MYISKVKIQNFRNFNDFEVNFNENVNVIIGPNNVGKSNLLKALSIVFDSNTNKHLGVDDFNKYITFEALKIQPPKITISISISQSSNENLISDDLAIVSDWLIKLEVPYKALLTYEFYLPTKEHERYLNMVSGATNKEEIWSIIDEEFIRLYTYNIWGGNPLNRIVAEGEWLRKFDFQFLDAIRDVERDMFTGRNALLKNIIDFFMDYDIKIDDDKTEEKKVQEIKEKKQRFKKEASGLLALLDNRMKEGKEEVLKYANAIGAIFDKSNINLEGSITDNDLYSALKLILKYSDDIKIPVTHNGLGYNNLIFMSLLLSKMQVNADGKYLGCNAKVFPMLAIEEPEAHLHPSMQYQFLKFVDDNIKGKKVRQVFITTHSTHIVASCPLDNIICLYKDENVTFAAYPGKAISNEKSKKYVQRFLDATKSDMLFAEKLILVEGITEQLLLSIFAQYLNEPLEEKHVSVISVDGRYYNHFLYMFDSNNKYAIKKKVACITDIDPLKRDLNNENSKFNKCYPFEFNVDYKNFEYKHNDIPEVYKDDNHPNVRFFTQDEEYGKTFEYDLILENPSLKLLITESISNKEELKALMDLYENNRPIDELIKTLRKTKENEYIIKSINNAPEGWNEDDKKKAIIAARYLNSVNKGENALELAYALQENLDKKGTTDYQEFNVPKYIRRAIEWVCKDED